MASLQSLLLFSSDNSHSEVARRLFSNIKSESNFPNPGKDSVSVNYLIELTQVPDEEEELLGLSIIENLLRWKWGFQAFFANSRAKEYLLVRLPKSMALAQRQYDVMKVANLMCTETQGLIEGETVSRILQYLNDGAFGENAKKQFDPSVASKGM